MRWPFRCWQGVVVVVSFEKEWVRPGQCVSLRKCYLCGTTFTAKNKPTCLSAKRVLTHNKYSLYKRSRNHKPSGTINLEVRLFVFKHLAILDGSNTSKEKINMTPTNTVGCPGPVDTCVQTTHPHNQLLHCIIQSLVLMVGKYLYASEQYPEFCDKLLRAKCIEIPLVQVTMGPWIIHVFT